MNLDQIESALRLVDREIWIITAVAGGRRGGLVATWVSSASIDRERPVLLAGIAPNHFTAELIDASRAFGAHLLREDQSPLAWNFARDSGRDRDKLAGLAVNTSPSGSPVLADCLAWFDCRVFSRYDAGDRLFFWADIVESRHVGRGQPMRQQAFLKGLSQSQLQHLDACQRADAAQLRPWHDAWRNKAVNPAADNWSS
jgi:flavin reductase (DIM6/NTAB) family NADH-FMN oxidoreductase RutF